MTREIREVDGVVVSDSATTIEGQNRAAIEDHAAQSLDANRTFLRLASPTNAQTLAQVKALTRQNNGMIRLLLRRLDGTT